MCARPKNIMYSIILHWSLFHACVVKFHRRQILEEHAEQCSYLAACTKTVKVLVQWRLLPHWTLPLNEIMIVSQVLFIHAKTTRKISTYLQHFLSWITCVLGRKDTPAGCATAHVLVGSSQQQQGPPLCQWGHDITSVYCHQYLCSLLQVS